MSGDGVPEFAGSFIVTGLSGSGKTVLSRSLEDSGYLCVDNIPLGLVPELFAQSAAEVERLVVVLDVRAKGLRDAFPTIHAALLAQYPRLRLIYVEAAPDILLRRFSVARRPHPLRARSLEQAIAEERDALASIRHLADLVVDTTALSPHDLRREVLSLTGQQEGQSLALEVESFSYLRGVPTTASLVFDVRFLPNPYFEAELRDLAGDDSAVHDWLEGQEGVTEALDRIAELVSSLVPRFSAEMKTHLSIAFGCTGGRHRSVFAAARMAECLRAAGYDVFLHHRDRDRWRYS